MVPKKKVERKPADQRPKKKPKVEPKENEGTETENVDDGRRKSARLCGKVCFLFVLSFYVLIISKIYIISVC